MGLRCSKEEGLSDFVCGSLLVGESVSEEKHNKEAKVIYNNCLMIYIYIYKTPADL